MAFPNFRPGWLIPNCLFMRVWILWSKRIACSVTTNLRAALPCSVDYFARVALSRLTNSRNAPGTPSGNCRKNAKPV